MGYIHTGVYGDHSTDGWLEWGLDEHFARKRAEKEAIGDFGATELILFADAFMENAVTKRHIRKAEELIQKAGMLAAREATFHGYEINGWEPEERI